MRCWVKSCSGEIVKLNQTELEYYDGYWPGDVEELEPADYYSDGWPGSVAAENEYKQAKLGF